MAGRAKAQVKLSEAEREQLRAWARRCKTAQALAQRSRIVLECAAGAPNQEVASQLEVTPQTVSKWRHRLVRLRLDGRWLPRARGRRAPSMMRGSTR
jgi:FixJ family two-component response regulator